MLFHAVLKYTRIHTLLCIYIIHLYYVSIFHILYSLYSTGNSPFKLCIDNLPPDIDEEALKNILLNFGGVKLLRLIKYDFTSNFIVQPQDTYATDEGNVNTDNSNENMNNTNISSIFDHNSTSERVRKSYYESGISEKDMKEKFGLSLEMKNKINKKDITATKKPLLKNPLMLAASIQPKLRKLSIAKAIKTDSLAFFVAKDAKSFQLLIRDDIRIFGVSINRHVCSILPTNNMKTLWLESKACFNMGHIKTILKYVCICGGDNIE